jgi:hypothetical protein
MPLHTYFDTFFVINNMPHSKKPGWIDWVNSAAREIILEDLEPSGYLFEKDGAVGETADLPPVLQGIMDERREFNMNLGRAMDVLRKDYPYMLYKSPGKFVLHSC